MTDKVYCPECLKRGRKQFVLYVDCKTAGIIFPYCKKCKKNIEVDLDIFDQYLETFRVQ